MSENIEVPVCFIGDSFVAGVGDSTALGWVGRLIAAAHHDRVHISGMNLGIRGETSQQIVERWDEVDRRRAVHADTMVISEFGCNDVLQWDGKLQVSEAGTRRAVATMAEQTPSGQLLIVGPPPISDPLICARIVARSHLIASECARLRVPFVPTFDALHRNHVWMKQITEGDGAHPEAQGYAAFANIVHTPIVQWLRGHRAGVSDIQARRT